jgi:hypothetical protein
MIIEVTRIINTMEILTNVVVWEMNCNTGTEPGTGWSCNQVRRAISYELNSNIGVFYTSAV